MDYWILLLAIAFILFSGGCITFVAVRMLLWLKAEWSNGEVPLTGVEQAARYWEAISAYHDLPDGSSVFLAVVNADGKVSVIKDETDIERTAMAILQHRDERKNRWAILKHWRSACRPSIDS